jgi:small subunit ribosomal protein S9
MATKTPTTKSAAPKAPRKPRAVAPKKKEVAVEETAPEISADVTMEVKLTAEKPTLAKGRYIFATGRRKTAVANVRLFSGNEESQVNKKAFDKYFAYDYHREEISKPLELTGLSKDYYFTAHVNGGGPHSQAGALRHGISTALGKLSEEVRKVLKKNGFLTRDDRKKERKKPGLKRARRSPQWAKR